MATIVTRSGKGSPLTNNEVDANFNNLNSDKAELSGATFTGVVRANAGVKVDNFTLDGTTLALSSGDFTIDVAGNTVINSDAGGVFFLDGSVTYATMLSTGAVFNEAGANADFRVESVGNANMLFVDANVNKVGVGLSAPLEPLHTQGRILSTTSYGSATQQIGTSIGQNAAVNATVDFRRWTGGGTNHGVGAIEVDASGVMHFYADSKTSNTPATTKRISLAPSGAFTTTPTTAGHAVFNGNGVNADFQVLSDGNSHMLFVDGGENRIGIGKSSPSHVLDVANPDASVSTVTAAFRAGGDNNDNRSNLFIGQQGNSRGLILRAGRETGDRAISQFILNGSGGTIGSNIINALEFYENGSGLYTTTFNQDGENVDFIVESDSLTHAIFVDASENHVNIGTASDFGDIFNVNGGGHFSSSVTLSRQTNDTGSTGLIFEKTRNTTVNGNTVVQNGDQLGFVAFRGNDGDQFIDGAYIISFVDGTPGNNDMPTSLQFWTTADGASSPSERMRITSSGAATFTSTINSGASNAVGIGGTPADVNATEVGPGYINLMRDDASDVSQIQLGGNGVLVGSIGNVAANLEVNSQGGTLKISTIGTERYGFDVEQFYPSTDGTQNLGISNLRFDDVFLSGGVHLGGTGAANRLSDFETGTFAATLTADTAPSSAQTQTCSYTKVGNLVTVFIRFTNKNTAGASGAMKITGLPFTSNNVVENQSSVPMMHNLTISEKYVTGYITGNTTVINFINNRNNAAWTITQINASSGVYLNMNMSYQSA